MGAVRVVRIHRVGRCGVLNLSIAKATRHIILERLEAAVEVRPSRRRLAFQVRTRNFQLISLEFYALAFGVRTSSQYSIRCLSANI